MPTVRDPKRPWKVTRTAHYNWSDFVSEFQRYRANARGVANSAQAVLDRLDDIDNVPAARRREAESDAGRKRTQAALMNRIYPKIRACPHDMTLRRALSELDLSHHERALLHREFLYFHFEWRLDFRWHDPRMLAGKRAVRAYVKERYYGTTRTPNRRSGIRRAGQGIRVSALE